MGKTGTEQVKYNLTDFWEEDPIIPKLVLLVSFTLGFTCYAVSALSDNCPVYLCL